MPQKTVKTRAKMTDGWEVDVTARHHTITIDQRKPTSGDVSANPLEFFFFSLGACFCTIGKIIAKQRKIELKSIDVMVEGDIDTDFLEGKTDDGRAGFTAIRIYADIDAPMTDIEKYEFMREIEKRCPIADNVINKTLMQLKAN